MVGRRMSPRGSFGLGSTAEAELVPLLDHIAREDVERLLVAVERGADILGGARTRRPRALPEDHRIRSELGGEIEVVEHLAERETAHLPVVGGEAAIAEDRVGEEVGGQHRD